MWISREKFEALERRIKSLELSQENSLFTVYEPKALERARMVGVYGFGHIKQERLNCKSVIQKILAHLGMEIEYTEGTPDVVELKKVKK